MEFPSFFIVMLMIKEKIQHVSSKRHVQGMTNVIFKPKNEIYTILKIK